MSALLGLQKVDLFKGLDSYTLREIAAPVQVDALQAQPGRDPPRWCRPRRVLRDRRAGARHGASRARPPHHLPRARGGRGIRRAFGDRRPRALRRRIGAARNAAGLDVARGIPRRPCQPRVGARAPAAPADRLGARARRPPARARRAAGAAPHLGRAAAPGARCRHQREPRAARSRADAQRHRQPGGHLARADHARALAPGARGTARARRPRPGAARRRRPGAARGRCAAGSRGWCRLRQCTSRVPSTASRRRGSAAPSWWPR